MYHKQQNFDIHVSISTGFLTCHRFVKVNCFIVKFSAYTGNRENAGHAEDI